MPARSRREIAYQAELVERIEAMFPGCFVLRNDPTVVQGIPDILILFGCGWAMLEVKLAANSPTRPNQPYYVERFNEMSYAAFVYPENEDEVLHDLQFAFGLIR